MTAIPELSGHCICGAVRYRMQGPPLFVHACHCTWCQRETGGAFAINVLIETERVQVEGPTERVATPSASGRGQQIVRCPSCHAALWSHYAGMGQAVSFVRAGTLDEPGRITPDIHIYVASKVPWLALPPEARAVPEYYDMKRLWPAASRERLKAARARSA